MRGNFAGSNTMSVFVKSLAKPFDKDELLVVVARSMERTDLRRQNRQLRKLIADSSSMGNIIGESEPMQAMFDIVTRAVPLNTTVLIHGESGTGKELVAGLPGRTPPSAVTI